MKKFLIIVLGIMEVISIFLAVKSFNSKETFIDDVKLINNVSNENSFAIMIQKNDRSGYEEYKVNDLVSNSFPTSGYIFNSDKSGCFDDNDKLITNSLKYNSNVVTVSTNKSSSCYVYFDLENWSYYGYLTSGGWCSASNYTGVDECASVSTNYDDARHGNNVFLKSNNGKAIYNGIDVLYENNDTLSIQVCALIDGVEKCADFNNPLKGDVQDGQRISSTDQTVYCELDTSDQAVCVDTTASRKSYLKADGTAGVSYN